MIYALLFDHTFRQTIELFPRTLIQTIKQMPGFEISRFVGLDQSLVQHLSCSICLNIFDNAVNSDCGHTFCKTCVQQLTAIGNKSCPECRQLMTTRKRSNSVAAHNQKGLVLVNVYLFSRNFKINSLISDLKIKCDFDFNGCQQTVPLGLLSDHLRQYQQQLQQQRNVT